MSSVDEAIDNHAEMARQQLQLLADISDPGLAYLDTRRCFEITNKAFKQRFGTPDRDTAAGDFFEGVCSPAVDEYLKTAIERGEVLSVQLDCTGADGDTERLRLRIVPHATPDEVRGVFVMFEAVEKRATEPEQSSDDGQDDRVIHLQRMAKLGEMAAGLAHEIRQPLAAIYNYANALTRMLRAGKSTEDLIALGDQIADQTGRADHIVANARNMIGQGRDQARSFNLQQVVADSMGLIEHRARQLAVDVRSSVPPSLPKIHGDPAQIEQILVNLMTNALNAMGNCDKRILTIDISSVDDKIVRVRVRDTGEGVSPERLSSIFNAFTTSTDGGMGMGLSISRALAERHGGQLWAETDIAEGASFVLDLPAQSGNQDEV